MITVTPTALPEVQVVTSRVFADARGFFVETYRAEHFAAHGLPTTWVQDNRSRSAQGTLRGLHFQRRQAQGKLVHCLRGEIWDVVVDVRVGSPTYGRWVGMTLTEAPGTALYVPEGFAHGFCALTDDAEVLYKCTAAYDPADEAGVRWDDPALAIAWPVRAPRLSAKDAALPTLAEAAAADRLPRWTP